MTTPEATPPKYIQTEDGEVYLSARHLIETVNGRIYLLESAERAIQRLIDEVEADLVQAAKESEA